MEREEKRRKLNVLEKRGQKKKGERGKKRAMRRIKGGTEYRTGQRTDNDRSRRITIDKMENEEQK